MKSKTQWMGSQERKERFGADGCLGYMAQCRTNLKNTVRKVSYDLSGGR
jgi:hypothetical protein